jgi:hypothetical protein
MNIELNNNIDGVKGKHQTLEAQRMPDTPANVGSEKLGHVTYSSSYIILYAISYTTYVILLKHWD